MTLIRKMVGVGAIVAIASMLFASVASAQPANPMQVFGVTGEGDVEEGTEVVAMIGDDEVGSATATADGWVIDIQNGTNGDEVSFTIDGAAAAETVTYEGFASEQVTLTAGEPEEGEGGGEETPTPAETGNAGLLGSTGTSMALVLALGVFAAALVAGGRTATRRS